MVVKVTGSWKSSPELVKSGRIICNTPENIETFPRSDWKMRTFIVGSIKKIFDDFGLRPVSRVKMSLIKAVKGP